MSQRRSSTGASIAGSAPEPADACSCAARTFGAGDGAFSESPGDFRDGPARVAAAWDDLNPSAGGSVFFNQSDSSFKVTWEDVPEWLATGANTFDITLYDNSSTCVPASGDDSDSDSDSDNDGNTAIQIDLRSVEAGDGITGVSGGIPTTSGVETESDLSALSRNGRKKIKMKDDAAIWENFSDGDQDLNGRSIEFNRLGRAFEDDFDIEW